ncbi:MAG TPA: hypothetical protein VK072_01500 [Candidatus Avamphibacillus sp.]|nr:hypothetical protein [Candidatus Avamphibacillus sp.]
MFEVIFFTVFLEIIKKSSSYSINLMVTLYYIGETLAAWDDSIEYIKNTWVKMVKE